MAELADALGSGLSGRKLVRVQVPPSAQLRIPAEKGVSCFNNPAYKVIRSTCYRVVKARGRCYVGGKNSDTISKNFPVTNQLETTFRIIEKRLFSR